MKILLDIKESKVLFFMELLKNFSFVKIQPFTNEKKSFLQKIAKERETFAEIEESTPKKVMNKNTFDEVWGIWADRDIDASTLRKQAWKIEN